MNNKTIKLPLVPPFLIFFSVWFAAEYFRYTFDDGSGMWWLLSIVMWFCINIFLIAAFLFHRFASSIPSKEVKIVYATSKEVNTDPEDSSIEEFVTKYKKKGNKFLDRQLKTFFFVLLLIPAVALFSLYSYNGSWVAMFFTGLAMVLAHTGFTRIVTVYSTLINKIDDSGNINNDD